MIVLDYLKPLSHKRLIERELEGVFCYHMSGWQMLSVPACRVGSCKGFWVLSPGFWSFPLIKNRRTVWRASKILGSRSHVDVHFGAIAVADDRVSTWCCGGMIVSVNVWWLRVMHVHSLLGGVGSAFSHLCCAHAYTCTQLARRIRHPTKQEATKHFFQEEGESSGGSLLGV